MPWPSSGLHRAVAITASNGRFVAVGSGGKRDRPRAWVSDDGLSWTKAPKVPAPKDATMSVVTSFDDGYVALGTVEAPRDQGDAGRHVAAWHSADGLEWERAVVEQPGLDGWDAVHVEVVDGPAGLLALGYFVEDHRVWRSTDGRYWAPTAAPDVDRAVAIAATPEAYLLTGFDSEEGLSIEDALTLFISTDGYSWNAVEGAPPITGVAASLEGTIVGTGFPELWATTDLERWERVWDDRGRNTAGDEGPARWLAPSGYGGAIGWTGSAFATTGGLYSPVCLDGSESCPPTPWLFSADGYTWVESTGPDGVPGPDRGTSMVGAASSDGSTVILGRTGSEGSDRSVAWLMESTPTDQ